MCVLVRVHAGGDGGGGTRDTMYGQATGALASLKLTPGELITDVDIKEGSK